MVAILGKGIDDFLSLLAGVGLMKLIQVTQKMERDLKQAEDEKKRDKLREGSIDVEYRVIENNDKNH